MAAERAKARPVSRWLSVGTDLDPGPKAPRAARDFLRDVLAVWDCDDDNSVAALLTSEVVTNAVRYAVSGVSVRLVVTGAVLRVEARDDGDGDPTVVSIGPESESGRGLLLVATLALRWGVQGCADGGKVVWFEVPIRRRAPLGTPPTA